MNFNEFLSGDLYKAQNALQLAGLMDPQKYADFQNLYQVYRNKEYTQLKAPRTIQKKGDVMSHGDKILRALDKVGLRNDIQDQIKVSKL